MQVISRGREQTAHFPALIPSWFAVHTYPRHEKRVAGELTLRRVDNYLPLIARLHQWSDRRKEVQLPLFPCYVFVRIAPTPEQQLEVLKSRGVLGFVGCGKQGIAIPENQIRDIQMLLNSKVLLDPYPFLKVGQRVRIRGGALDGVEGILVRRNGARRLIISVDTLERSLAISVEGLEIEAI